MGLAWQASPQHSSQHRLAPTTPVAHPVPPPRAKRTTTPWCTGPRFGPAAPPLAHRRHRSRAAQCRRRRPESPRPSRRAALGRGGGGCGAGGSWASGERRHTPLPTIAVISGSTTGVQLPAGNALRGRVGRGGALRQVRAMPLSAKAIRVDEADALGAAVTARPRVGTPGQFP